MVRTELAVLKPTRVVTIGASMGAYAAIRAGLSLGAASILAFGPQVFIDPAARDALALPWMFFDETLRRLGVVCAAEGVSMEPLTAIEPRGVCAWEGRPDSGALGCTTVEIHLGEEATGDVREAAMLREAVATRCREPPGSERCRVELLVHKRLGHALVKDLRDGGALEDLMAKHLSDSSDAATSNRGPTAQGHPMNHLHRHRCPRRCRCRCRFFAPPAPRCHCRSWPIPLEWDVGGLQAEWHMDVARATRSGLPLVARCNMRADQYGTKRQPCHVEHVEHAGHAGPTSK